MVEASHNPTKIIFTVGEGLALPVNK